MAKTINLQDMFLNQVRKEGIGVTIYLMGGVQLRGNVRGFDAFTVMLDSPGKPTQLVYKHAITSIVPSRPIGQNDPRGHHDGHRDDHQEGHEESGEPGAPDRGPEE